MYEYRDTISYCTDIYYHQYEGHKANVDEFLNEIGYIHGHKSDTTVEFSFEAEDLWDICEKANEVEIELQSRGINFTADKDKVHDAA